MRTSIRHVTIGAAFLWLAFGAMALSCDGAQAFVYKVLHSFKGGRDGGYASGGLVPDPNGNLYGLTGFGGNACDCGTVYKISPKGKEAVFYRFKGGSLGWEPLGRLIRDGTGNLYGVTGLGGSTACGDSGGCGTVFRLSPDGKHRVLHVFTGGASDGSHPAGDLVRDSDGNLYGTAAGGSAGCGSPWGCGVVYRLAANGSMTLLYVFQGGSDGGKPIGGMLRDDSGNLYGATFYGGNHGSFFPYGMGTVFKLTPDGKETVLHAFDGTDGFNPDTSLTRDPSGNLYGGTYGRSATIYQISPTGDFKTIFQFNSNDANGWFPSGEPLVDGQGNLFINNLYGGISSDPDCGVFRCGTVFEWAADGTTFARHEFGAWAQDGFAPVGNLLLTGRKVYGVTYSGGEYGNGTVWVLAL